MLFFGQVPELVENIEREMHEAADAERFEDGAADRIRRSSARSSPSRS